jgi:predicted Zn-dependent peptidase
MSGFSHKPEILSDRRLGEEVHRFDLPCGLPVLVHLRPGYRKKFAVLGVNFGSVDRTFVDRATGEARQVPEGTAHFLEHKLFEQETGDAFDRFTKHGATANASTSFRNTSYFFSCPENFPQNLRTLLSLVSRPHFTEQSIEKEKGIVAQEIRMYGDSPDWRCFIHLVQALFVRHPVRTDITGTVESVARIDLESLLACFRNFYDPGNLCLVVSGDLDPEAVAEAARRAMPKNGVGAPAVRIEEREPKSVAQRRVSERAPVRRAKLILGFKDREVPVRGPDLQRRDLLTGILLGLMFSSSSERYRRLYEAGEIDDSFYPSYAGDEDFGFVTLGGETDDPERMRSVLLREIRRFGREGFSTEDFGRIVHKMIGRFVRSLDSQESTAFMLMSSVFRNTDPFRRPALLRTIRPEDVMVRHAQLFGAKNHATSIVSPA